MMELLYILIGFGIGVLVIVFLIAQGAVGSISLRDSAAGHQADHDAEILLREINKPEYQQPNRSNP